MKKLAIVFAVLLFGVVGCVRLAPVEGEFTVSVDRSRPPFNVTLSYSAAVPGDDGLYFWSGPWGQDVTTVPTYTRYVESVDDNPIEFDVYWTNGADELDPDPIFYTMTNKMPMVVRQPRFSVASAFNPGGTIGVYLTELQPTQFYIVDLRDCVYDPDGDKITVTDLNVWTFHKPGYRPNQFESPYQDILQQFVDEDYVVEQDNAIFTTPPGKIRWDGVDGKFGWSPRFWLVLNPENGLPYAPFDIDPSYSYDPACADLGTIDLPFGGAVIEATFSDGMGGVVTGQWVFLVGTTSCD